MSYVTVPLLFLAVIFSPAVLQAEKGDVTIDVIAEQTEAGRKIERPTPGHPAYYMASVFDYHWGGQKTFWQRPPPSRADVVGILAKELSSQGYVGADRDHPASLMLVFLWGFKQPAPNSIEAYHHYIENRPPIPATMQLGDMGNTGDMLDLTCGTKVRNVWYVHFGPELDQAVEAAGVPRYYIVVQAFDYSDWLHHKYTALWTARVSVPYWGHYYDQTLPALLKVGAPMFGRDMATPLLVKTSIVPEGRVVVGTPVIRGDELPTTPSPPKQ